MFIKCPCEWKITIKETGMKDLSCEEFKLWIKIPVQLRSWQKAEGM
jgi:hypothetical protein